MNDRDWDEASSEADDGHSGGDEEENARTVDGAGGQSDENSEQSEKRDLTPEDLKRILNGENPESLPKSVLASVTRSMSYQSHLPPPRVMRGYEDIQPGALDRFLTLTEEEAKHRRWREKFQLESDGKFDRHALDVGGGIAALFAVVAGVCAVMGQPWVAVTMMAPSTIVGVLNIFMRRPRRQIEADAGKTDP